MQFFTRFVAGRRGNLAAQAAFALGAALALPELREAQAAGPAEVGVWINHEGKGAVEIKPCGAALCGNIVWLKNPVNDQGQPLFDRRNPDETKRTRPICGLAVIGNVKRTSEGWDEGWIYNPEEGAQFDVALQASGDRLTVTGYKGIKLFSKTLIWTRAPADLQRCDGAAPQQTKAKPVVVPPKLATPKPQDGSPAPAARKPVTATEAPAGEKPAAKPGVATEAKKPVAKDAKTTTAAKQPAGGPAPAKKAAAPTTGTSKKAAIENPAKPGGTPSAKTAAPAIKAAAKPAAGTAKAAAGSPIPPAPTAAKKPVAKKPATATASTAGDKKATVPSDQGAAKPAAKKKTADEDDASSTVE